MLLLFSFPEREVWYYSGDAGSTGGITGGITGEVNLGCTLATSGGGGVEAECCKRMDWAWAGRDVIE